jgi:hypothetical protein
MPGFWNRRRKNPEPSKALSMVRAYIAAARVEGLQRLSLGPFACCGRKWAALSFAQLLPGGQLSVPLSSGGPGGYGFANGKVGKAEASPAVSSESTFAQARFPNVPLAR